MKRYTFLWPLLFLSVAFGCSDKCPLGGKVMFSDNGEPIKECIIFFTADNFVAQGNVIKPDGTYVVGSTGLKDGLPRGTYQVHIAGGQQVSTNAKGESTYSSLIDNRYRSAETSGLTFTVDGKTRKFDIKLDRAK